MRQGDRRENLVAKSKINMVNNMKIDLTQIVMLLSRSNNLTFAQRQRLEALVINGLAENLTDTIITKLN